MAPVGREPFDCGHRTAVHLGQCQPAASDLSAVNEYRARTTGFDTTTILGAGQLQAIPQNPQQRGLGGFTDFMGFTVNFQRDRLGSFLYAGRDV